MIAHPSFWRGIGSHQLRNPHCKYSELFLFPNNYIEKCHPFEVAFLISSFSLVDRHLAEFASRNHIRELMGFGRKIPSCRPDESTRSLQG